MNILTWNVKNNKTLGFYKYLNNKLSKLNIDILILQEFLTGDENEIKNFVEIKYPKNGDPLYVRIFLRVNSTLNYQNVSHSIGNKLLSVEIFKPGKFNFTLVGVHYYSKAGRSNLQQNNSNADFTLNIKQIESINKHRKTIVAGDFNYLPHDLHLNDPTQLNAINSKEVIRNFTSRKCGRFTYDFFYNPMWNLIGDYNYKTKKDKVCGTYFWEADDAEKFYWNLFDGVLINQTIMDCIDISKIDIIDDILDYSNRPEVIQFSDHLPVKFHIKTKELK